MNHLSHGFKIHYLAPIIITTGALYSTYLFNYFLRRGFHPTTGALPPYPIILKPYPAVVIIIRIIAIISLALGVTLIIIYWMMIILSAVLFAIAFLVLRSVEKSNKERLIIEKHKIIYKTQKKEEVMTKEEMYFFFVNVRTNQVVLAMEQDPRQLKIPMMFQNMCYLYDTLSDWQEEHQKQEKTA